MIAEHQITKAKPVPPPAAVTDDTLPRGAEVLLHALVNEGVDTIFGYPGGAGFAFVMCCSAIIGVQWAVGSRQ